MTWTYEGTPFPAVNPCSGLPIPAQPTSQPCIDTVRFLIGDTDSTDQLLQDGEVLGLLTQNNSSVYQAAIEGARSIAALFARQADKTVGDLHIIASQRTKAYEALIKSLQAQAMRHDAPLAYAGGISISDKENNEEDDDLVAPSFTKGMMDDPGTSPSFSEMTDGFDGFSTQTPGG